MIIMVQFKGFISVSSFQNRAAKMYSRYNRANSLICDILPFYPHFPVFGNSGNSDPDVVSSSYFQELSIPSTSPVSPWSHVDFFIHLVRNFTSLHPFCAK